MVFALLELFRSRCIIGFRDSPLSVLLTASQSGDGYIDALGLPGVFLEPVLKLKADWPIMVYSRYTPGDRTGLCSHRYIFGDMKIDFRSIAHQ